MAIYAEAGSSFFQQGGVKPSGWLTMSADRPSIDHVAVDDGTGNDTGDWELSLSVYLRQLRELSDEKQEAGVTASIPVGATGSQTTQNVDFDTDHDSTAYLNNKASGTTVDINFRCNDNELRVFTKTVLTNLLAEINEYHHDCLENEKTHKASLEAAEDPSTIDFTTGWPSTSITVTG